MTTTMTSPTVAMTKPSLPPKPVKYRAPAPPRPHPPSSVARPPSSHLSESDTSAADAVTEVVKKYQTPSPPRADAVPPSSGHSLASTSPPRPTPTMRREPMQVIPTSYSSRSNERKDANHDHSSSKSSRVDSNQLRHSTSPGTDCDVTAKPVIPDVKLLARSSDVRTSFLLRTRHCQRPTSHHLTEQQLQQQLRACRSSESLDRISLLADASARPPPVPSADPPDSPKNLLLDKSCRSSFVDPDCPPAAAQLRRSVYLDLGEYQTLLKHGQQDAVYSLPQPQCYGDDTLRAVRLITEKYDTFKRRQLRAMSFRDAPSKPGSQDHGRSDDATHAIDEGVETSDNPATPDITASSATSPDVVASAQQQRATTTTMTTTSTTTTTTTTTTSPTTTLSRTIISLSRYGLESGLSCSSVDDVTLAASAAEAAAAAGGVSSTADDDATPAASDEICGMSRTDRLRIEMFYRSRETEVYVCRCMADLFLGAVSSSSEKTDADRWIQLHTGVPVWLLNTGRAVRRRELVVLLADRQTGLPLWRDRISYLSNYGPVDDATSSTSAVHRLRLSSSLSKSVRLAMFCSRSAAAFLARFRRITADPCDDLWKISESPANPARLGRRAEKSKSRAVSKASISVPCSVVLVTRVDPRHPNFRASFGHLLPASPPPPGGPDAASHPVDATTNVNCGEKSDETSAECEFRPRLPTR